MSDRVFYGKPLTFRPKRHQYFWDGEAIPNVTSILGRLGKPALIQWAANCAVDHVRGALQNGGITDAALEAARTAHAVIRNDAGGVGTILHRFAQRVQMGEAFDMAELTANLKPEAAEQVLRCLGALRQWFASHELGEADLERRVFSRVLRYAGTTDRWGLIDGRMAVLDFKTSGSVADRRTGDLYPEPWLQLAGYEVALREELRLPKSLGVWHYVIHLNKITGQCTSYIRSPDETDTAIAVWHHLVELDRHMRQMPKKKTEASREVAA